MIENYEPVKLLTVTTVDGVKLTIKIISDADKIVEAHFLEPDEDGKVEIPATVEIDGKTYTVTEIAASAFKDNKELTEVTIPGTVTTIGAGAFAGCENLKAIYVLSPTPAILNEAAARGLIRKADGTAVSQFDGVDLETCVLYVPYGSKTAYEQAEGWKQFKHIVEMVPEGIKIDTVDTIGDEGEADVYSTAGVLMRKATKTLKGLKPGVYIIGTRKVLVK